jgi:hypothetical protein
MDDLQKQCLRVAIVTLNFTIIGYQFLFNMGRSFTYGKLALGIVLGLAAAGIAYLATKLTQK